MLIKDFRVTFLSFQDTEDLLELHTEEHFDDVENYPQGQGKSFKELISSSNVFHHHFTYLKKIFRYKMAMEYSAI